MSKTVLFLLADCPGYFVQLIYKMAQNLRAKGAEVIFASPTPYYELYKGVTLSDLGRSYYFSDFLEMEIDPMELEAVKINYWWAYPTYVRDHYFLGRHRNEWNVYKKVSLFHQQILKENRPDVVISEPPSNAFLYTAFAHIRRLGIPYLGYISARLPHYFNVFLDEYGEYLLENAAVDSRPDSAASGIPDYMQDQSIALQESGIISKLWRMIATPTPRSLESGNTVLHQMRAYYKRYWRQWRYRQALRANLFSFNVDLEQKINILHPLHFRPEASTSVLARYYENDLELLKNMAFSLPANAQLVVKEHKAAVGIRGVDFYNRLLSFPNTVLVHPDFPLAVHLVKFDAVVVLTSTVGFEALQVGIPVFVLGNVFYADYPGATRIESYKELEHHLRQLSKQSKQPNPEVMERYKVHCFPGQFNYMNKTVVTQENIENLLAPVWQVLMARQEEI